jgi:hypothetical protein
VVHCRSPSTGCPQPSACRWAAVRRVGSLARVLTYQDEVALCPTVDGARFDRVGPGCVPWTLALSPGLRRPHSQPTPAGGETAPVFVSAARRCTSPGADRDQAHLPAEQSSAGKDPWFSVAYAYPCWPLHPVGSAPQGPHRIVRLIADGRSRPCCPPGSDFGVRATSRRR